MHVHSTVVFNSMYDYNLAWKYTVEFGYTFYLPSTVAIMYYQVYIQPEQHSDKELL